MGHNIIPEVKKILSGITVAESKKLASKVMRLKTAEKVEVFLKEYFNKKYPELVFEQGVKSYGEK